MNRQYHVVYAGTGFAIYEKFLLPLRYVLDHALDNKSIIAMASMGQWQMQYTVLVCNIRNMPSYFIFAEFYLAPFSILL